MNLLLAISIDQLLVPIILVAFIVVLYFAYAMRNKKYVMRAQEMMDKLKPGARLKTYSGIYGTVVEIDDINGVKVALIETGNEKHKSYFTIDASAIFDVESDQSVEDIKTDDKIENDIQKEIEAEKKKEKKQEKKEQK